MLLQSEIVPERARLGRPSFLERVYLLWTFRNFTSLLLVVLNHRQQKLVDRLYSLQKFVSPAFENGMFDQLLIGTVERLSPRPSQTETQAEGALSGLAVSGGLFTLSRRIPFPPRAIELGK